MAAIGMSPDEVSAVQRTWKLATVNLKQNGIEIMIALFTQHKDYVQFFKKLQNVATEDLPKNVSFRAHAVTFMHGLSAMVDSLEDTDELIGLLHANAERHYPRKVTVNMYRNTVNLVPGFLKDKLGSEMDDIALSGWKKVIDAIVSVIGDKLEKIKIQDLGTEIE